MTAIDVNGNSNIQVETITVDDSVRKGVDGDIYLNKPSKKYIKAQMEDKFDYRDCKEISVYVRPNDESNFIPLESSYIPKELKEKYMFDPKYRPSKIFYQALCNLSPAEVDYILPTVDNCKGEIKTEVLCKIAKASKSDLRKQTCYCARLNAEIRKSAKSAKR